MSTPVQAIPEGYHSVTVSLSIKNAKEAIEFYKKAFNAVESFRMEADNGGILHAEFKIGDSVVMISDEYPEWGALSPATVGGCPVTLRVYLEDVDAAHAQALAAGATETMPPATQFYGDRSSGVIDPYGYRWSLSTHVEDIDPEEMDRRIAKFKAEGG